MSFKSFFLLHERQFFIDLAKFTEVIISRLENKIRDKKNGVRSGSKITVPVTKDKKIDFKFYKGYSRRTHETRKLNNWTDTDVQAIYYGQDAQHNATIEVYFNPAKSSEAYYRDKKFEDVIDGSLPKFIKDSIRHELSHAYEDVVKDVAKFKENDYSVSNDNSHFDQDEEINAYLSQFLTSELSVNRDVMFRITQGDIHGAVNAFVRKLKEQPFFSKITAQNKIWVLKTIFTFVHDIVEKKKATLPT